MSLSLISMLNSFVHSLHIQAKFCARYVSEFFCTTQAIVEMARCRCKTDCSTLRCSCWYNLLVATGSLCPYWSYNGSKGCQCMTVAWYYTRLRKCTRFVHLVFSWQLVAFCKLFTEHLSSEIKYVGNLIVL